MPLLGSCLACKTRVFGRDAKVASDYTAAAAAGAANGASSAEIGRHHSDGGSIGSDGVAEEPSEALAAARSTARSELDSLFSDLYPGNDGEDGLKASRNERLSKGYQSVTLTYGEVSAVGVRCFN